MSDAPVGAFLRSVLLDAIPALSILFLLLLTALPLGLPPNLRLGGLLPLIGISYWSLVRPRAMGLLMVFILGLVTDCIVFSSLGLHGFIFVLTQAVLRKQRRFLVGQGFWVLWAAFALVLFAAYGLEWCLSSLLSLTILPFVPTLFSPAMAWLCLPLIAALLSALHNVMDLFDEPIA